MTDSAWALAFAIESLLLGLWVIGFLGHSQTYWRLGPISWTRAGVVGLLQIGSVRFAKIGQQWRRVASINRELNSIVDPPSLFQSTADSE